MSRYQQARSQGIHFEVYRGDESDDEFPRLAKSFVAAERMAMHLHKRCADGARLNVTLANGSTISLFTKPQGV